MRVEVALPLAMKDLVRLRLKEAVAERALFEQRYAMTFAKFAQEWETGRIPNGHSSLSNRILGMGGRRCSNELTRLLELGATLP